MDDVLPLRCACGHVSGRVLARARVQRIVCHCRGCQAYARWLERPELLDAAGGTDIYQLTPSQLKIDRGRERVGCVRLTERGAMRWHTTCCRTPLANTLDRAWVPWIGVPHLWVDADDTRAPQLAPVRFRIHTRAARGPVPGGHPSGPASLVLQTLWGALRDVIRGRARPHPLFDDDGRPCVAPVTIDAAERAALGL